MKNDFLSLDWHDADLLEINIKRYDPGNKDEVIIVVQWPNGKKNTITFIDCYAFESQMNFGIIPIANTESIYSATVIESSEQITDIKLKWSSIAESHLKGLKCYQINTASTNSILNIFALGYIIS